MIPGTFFADNLWLMGIGIVILFVTFILLGDESDTLAGLLLCALSWYCIYEYGWGAVFAIIMLSLIFMGIPIAVTVVPPIFAFVFTFIFSLHFIRFLRKSKHK